MKWFLLCLFAAANAFAQDIAIRECEIHNEERASLRGNDVCVQDLNCKAVNEMKGLYVMTEKLAYCYPDTLSGRCPSDGDDCLYPSRPLSKADISAIRYQDLNEPTGPKQPCDFTCGSVRQGVRPTLPKNDQGAH